MFKALAERFILLSAVSLVLEACLPNTSTGKFARACIETVKLLLVLAPIANALYG